MTCESCQAKHPTILHIKRFSEPRSEQKSVAAQPEAVLLFHSERVKELGLVKIAYLLLCQSRLNFAMEEKCNYLCLPGPRQYRYVLYGEAHDQAQR